MPDLQSELTKVLTQKHFDDDEPSEQEFIDAQTGEIVKLPSTEPTKIEKVFNIIRANPGISMRELQHLALKENVDGNYTTYAVREMCDHKRCVRTEDTPFGKVMYVTKTTYVREPPRTRKVKTKAEVKPEVAPEPTAPATVEKPKAFNADEIINNMTVLQAKELLVKLKEVFGV